MLVTLCHMFVLLRHQALFLAEAQRGSRRVTKLYHGLYCVSASQRIYAEMYTNTLDSVKFKEFSHSSGANVW